MVFGFAKDGESFLFSNACPPGQEIGEEAGPVTKMLTEFTETEKYSAFMSGA
jgi:hypothetical protein